MYLADEGHRNNNCQIADDIFDYGDDYKIGIKDGDINQDGQFFEGIEYFQYFTTK